VPDDVLIKLTERFERNNPAARGSGLGLAIADTIMQQAGGQLLLQSPATGEVDGFEAIVILPQPDGVLPQTIRDEPSGPPSRTNI
jgi:two-component system OmpR family sensor kinase